MFFNINRTRFIFSFLIAGLTLILSCGGGSDPLIENPSNLVIDIIIKGVNTANPNGDGSGVVTVNFSADNANSYIINMGDGGEAMETASNSISYTYAGGGIKTFTIYVSAYNTDQFISGSTSITIKIDSGLFWSDEFDGNGALNSSKWTYETGNGNNGWGNGEKQYYTNRLENAKVENGYLTITAKKESYEGFQYTSARVITKGKFDFTYGRVDIRAKLPEGDGTWPALWMLGSDISTVGWPACGEIDIMEHWGYNPGVVSSATHTSACSGGCSNVSVGHTTLSDYSTAFHVYSLEWTENELRFLIDNEYKYSYNPSTKDSANWPYNKAQFFIMNIAMGGSWFDVDPNFVSATMQIDYIRVYK